MRRLVPWLLLAAAAAGLWLAWPRAPRPAPPADPLEGWRALTPAHAAYLELVLLAVLDRAAAADATDPLELAEDLTRGLGLPGVLAAGPCPLLKSEHDRDGDGLARWRYRLGEEAGPCRLLLADGSALELAGAVELGDADDGDAAEVRYTLRTREFHLTLRPPAAEPLALEAALRYTLPREEAGTIWSAAELLLTAGERRVYYAWSGPRKKEPLPEGRAYTVGGSVRLAAAVAASGRAGLLAGEVELVPLVLPAVCAEGAHPYASGRLAAYDGTGRLLLRLEPRGCGRWPALSGPVGNVR